MNDKEILIEIKKLLKKQTNKEISINSNIKDLGLDSLDSLDLIMEAEEKFDITVPDDELIRIKTIKDLIEIIKNLNNNLQ